MAIIMNTPANYSCALIKAIIVDKNTVNAVNDMIIINNTPAKYISAMIKTILVASHINCIVARCLINVVYLTACAFIRSR